MSSTTFHPVDQKLITAGIARAIAEGRHSNVFRPVCQQCGEYCDGYAHRTFDGKYVGACCAPPPPKPIGASA